MTTTPSMRSSPIESFYTAPSSFNSTDELSSIVNLNGKSYHLTVYHKKPDTDWEEITQSYLEQAKGVDLKKILQEHIKFPYQNIEITTSVDLKAGFVCKTKDTDGMMRKVVGFNLTESQKSKIFAVLKKIKAPKCILTSSSLSEENVKTLDSSSIKMSLEEVKAERVNEYLKEAASFNLSENCDQNSIETPNKKARLEGFNKSKPIDHEQAIGLDNSGNNCCINALLQIILNNPELRKIWEECFPEARDLYYEALREGKSSAPNAVSNEFRKQLVQRSRFNLIDKSLFTQDDPTAFLEVFFNVCKEELDLSHMKIHFERMKYKQQIGGEERRPTIEKSESHEQFRISISNKLNRNTTLDELLENHCLEINKKEEKGMKVKYIAEDRYVSLPDHLIIDLFTNNRKDAYNVCIPENLSFPQDLLKDRHAYAYDLEGFVVHLGQSNMNGHYIAYRKVNGQWKKFDDSRVTNIDEKQLQLILGNSQKPSFMQRWFGSSKQSYICMLSYSKKPSL